MRIALLAAALVAVLGVAGCGDDDEDAAAKAADEKVTALQQRIVQEDELRSFKANGEPAGAANPRDWAALGTDPDGAEAEAARLRTAGFVAGATQLLIGSEGVEGVSTVAQYRSEAAAKAEQEYVLRGATEADSSLERFDVPGVPGAQGYTSTVRRAQSRDVIWSAGPYVYMIGVAYRRRIDQPPTAKDLAAAAEAQYKRVQ